MTTNPIFDTVTVNGVVTAASASIPTIVPFDDPNNNSGLGVPAILRGTVSTYNLGGLTIGAGLSTPVRQANATALQSAINYAAVNGKFLEIVPGTYEINSSTGLTIPAQGFNKYTMTLRGDPAGTIIMQYYNGGTGAPVLTIGDVTGTTASVGLDIYGLTLRYGASQAGLTSSTPFVVGNTIWGKIAGMFISDSIFPGYDAMLVSGGNNFSMTWDNLALGGCQRNMLHIAATGTQSVWRNVYMNNGGSNVFNPLSGAYLYFDTNDVGHFDNVNMEWGACQYLVYAANTTTNLEFDALHFEGIKMSGSFPTMFWLSGAQLKIGLLNIVDVLVQSANLGGTTAQIFVDYSPIPSAVQVDSMIWTNTALGQINTPFSMLVASGAPGDDVPVLTVNSGFLQDQTFTNIFNGRFQFDGHMPAATFAAPTKWSSYKYGASASLVDRANIPVSATYTHYGQHENASILVPASITGFTITLAATMGATGTQAVRTGNTVHVRRQSGSASGTLLVKDDAGTTLTTSTTAAADFWYVFNGTHYVTFTPVS